MRDLIAELTRNAPSFGLFQAISILERAFPDRARVGAGMGSDEAVRLMADVSLAFQPSDIQAVRPSKREGPPLSLSSAVMALAGSQGPLPIHITEWLLERRRDRDIAPLEFLDIFNQRLLGLLYRGRARHNLSLSAPAGTTPPIVNVLRQLGGHASGGAASEAGHWLRHVGLEGPAPRSMASLLTVLKDRTGLVITGRQFIGDWQALDSREWAVLTSVGRRQPHGGAALGLNSCLGQRAWDQGAAIELEIKPTQVTEFMALLPGGDSHALLGSLTRRHLQGDVQLQCRLHWPALDRQPSSPPRFTLGRPTPVRAESELPDRVARLGHTTWLLGPERPAVCGDSRPNRALDAVRFKYRALPTEGPDHGN